MNALQQMQIDFEEVRRLYLANERALKLEVVRRENIELLLKSTENNLGKTVSFLEKTQKQSEVLTAMIVA